MIIICTSFLIINFITQGVSAEAPPDAPKNLLVQRNTANSIMLFWGPSYKGGPIKDTLF
jgi:hypothetical protein